MKLLGYIQRKGFGLRKEQSVLVGKGLWRKDNPGKRKGEVGNWKGWKVSARLEEGQTSLWQAVLGNRIRSTGGWEL